MNNQGKIRSLDQQIGRSEDSRNRPPKKISFQSILFLISCSFALNFQNFATFTHVQATFIQDSPSVLGLTIQRNTTHYNITWTDTLEVNGAIIDWYCLQIRNADDTYTRPCIYNSTYPVSPITIPNSVMIDIYGYAPGQYVTAQINQKRQNSATIIYTISGDLEVTTGQDLIDIPRGAVTGLAVTLSTRQSIVLSWSAFSGAIADTGNSPLTAYYVERSCATCANGWMHLSSTSLSTSQTLTLSAIEANGVTYSSTYTLRVTPINICGLGLTKSTLVFTTKAAPSPPTVAYTPIKNVLTALKIQVSWTAIPSTDEDLTGGYPITSYQLLRALSPATSIANYTVLVDQNVLTFTQTTGWLWNTSYDYVVRAKNQLGLGPISPALNLKTGIDPALCVLPRGMTKPELVDVAPLSVSIKWSELTDMNLNGGDFPIFYQVEYSSNNSTWTALNANGALVLEYTHTVTAIFPSGSTQYYRLKAKNNVGLGTVPSPVLAVVADTLPTGMTNITNGTINPTDITLTWTELSNKTLNGGDLPIFYGVQWFDTSKSAWTELNTGGPLTLSYTHTMASIFPSASTQKYRVYPKNGVGAGSVFSNILTVLCDEYPIQAVTATVKEVQPKSLTIQWNELLLDSQNGRDVPSFYLVETALSTDPTAWTALNEGGAMATDYTLTLPNSAVFDETKQYLFRIKAKNGVGYAPDYSAVLSVQPDQRPLGMTPPYLKSTSLISNGGQRMKWDPLLDMKLNGGDVPFFYSIEHSADNINFYNFTTDIVKTTYFEVDHNPCTILTNRAYYRVKAENLVGMSNIYSSSVMVQTTMNKAQAASTSNYTIGVCWTNPKDIYLCWSDSTDMWGPTSRPNFFQVEWLNPQPLGLLTCDDVSLTYLNDWSNPTTNPSSKWQVVSPTSGTKFTSFKHELPAGIFANNVFPSNTNQCYRVRMHIGGVPHSQPTPVRKVLADSLPTFMHAPTLVEVHPYNVTVKWNPLNLTSQNGRDDPIFYLLEWYNYESASWQALTSMATTGLVLNYTQIRSGSYYSVSAILRYRVTAQNGVGMGVPSEELVISPDKAPTGMDPIGVDSIQPFSINVVWSELTPTLNGGDPPIYYKLEWLNPVTKTWTILNGETTDKAFNFTHNVATMFEANSNQQYRVLPKNQIGWGTAYSPVLTVVCDTFPSAMLIPAAVNIQPKEILVTWNPLVSDADTGRDPIKYYQLDWDQGIGSWVEITDSTINGISTSYSLIPADDQIFNANTNVKFRARATNTIGFGPYSPSLTVLTDGPPTKMNTPTATVISPKQVSLKWNPISSQADTGRDPVIYYRLDYLVRPCYSSTEMSCLINTDSEDVWVEVTAEAVQGTSTTFVHTFQTNLKADENFYYRVCPKNGVGYGVCSARFTMLSDTTPKFMYPPVVTDANITPYWIYLTWSPITTDLNTGRDPAIFYDLQCDFGTQEQNWQTLIQETAGLLLGFNMTSTTMFPNGRTYNFRLRAKNGVGWGVYSTVTPVLLDQTPTRMNPPVIPVATITPLGMTITWTAIAFMTDGGRDPIIYYGLEWDQGINQWENITQEAVQGVSTSVVKNFAAPFASGQPIKFRTYAKNMIGSGEYSAEVTAYADQVPQFMPTPTLVSVDPKLIKISWVEIPVAQNGGDVATYYEVSCDLGTSTWITLTTDTNSLQLAYSHASTLPFASGSIIKYRVRGKNGVGFGAYSNELSVQADEVPTMMNLPEVNQLLHVAPTWIYLTWSGIFDDDQTGRDAIIYYQLEWLNDTSYSWEILTTDTGIVKYNFNFTSPTVFPTNSSQVFRLTAKNGVGLGVESAYFEVITDSVPIFANIPFNTSVVEPKKVGLRWATVTDFDQTGGDPVISYQLEFDYGLLTGLEDWRVINNPATQGTVTEFTFISPTVFPSGAILRFRMACINGIGVGSYSDIGEVQADSVPMQTFPPVVNYPLNHINPTWVYLTWPKLSDAFDQSGGDPVIFYKLERYLDEGIWIDLNTYNQESSIVADSFNYTVSQSSVFASGSNLQFRLTALNGVGYGMPSENLIIEADKVPQFMNVPILRLNMINPKWMLVEWNELDPTNWEQTGGDAINYYELEWDKGTNGETWTIVTTPTDGVKTQCNVTSNTIIPSGSTQKFRMRARNGVGMGLNSEILNVQADKVPQYMNAPVVKLDDIKPKSILLTWTPLDSSNLEHTGGDEVIYYEVQWDNSTQGQQWVTLNTYTVGQQVNLQYMHVVQTPFASGSLQKYRVRGMNGVGLGLFSEVLDVYADKVPQYMNIPEVNFVGNQINPTWINLYWLPLTVSDYAVTGGDPPIYYELQWDEGSNEERWKVLTTYTPGQNINLSFNHTVTQVFPSGSMQKYRLRAMNGVGIGLFSAVANIEADKVPQFMNFPKVNYQANHINPKWIYLTWDPLSDQTWDHTGGDPAIYYELQWSVDQITDIWTTLTTYIPNQPLNLAFNHTITDIFPSGSTQYYRLRARNGVGLGLFSEIYEAQADKVPQFMNIPKVDYSPNHINPHWIFLTWDALIESEWSNTGGDRPVEYVLEWNDMISIASDSSIQENWKVISSQEAIDGKTLFTFNHSITNGPFPSGSLQQYRIKAKNGVGYGLYSLIKDVYADKVPQFMNKPKVNYLANHINPTWIYITWDALIETEWEKTGGDPGIYYELQWDLGTQGEQWQILTTYTPNSPININFNHTLSQPFPSGSMQKYKLRARNGVGIGLFSDILDVEADKVPQFMNIPKVDYLANHINPTWIYLTWEPLIETEWDKTGGDPAIYYELQWDLGSLGDQWVILTTFTPSQAINQNFNHTLSQPFPSGSMQKYKLRARNGVGIGLFSEVLDVQADKVPQFMNIPKVDYLANDINPHWIKITWEPLIDTEWNNTGGDPAVYYGLEWDQAKDQWQNLTTEALGKILTFNHTSLDKPFTSDCTIKFRAYAKNGVGFGEYSAVHTIKADSIPIRMNSPVMVNVDYNEISIKWDEIKDWSDTGGDDIQYYKVEFFNKTCYLGDTIDCTNSQGTWQELTTFQSQLNKLTYKHTIDKDRHFSRDKLFDYRICAQNGVGMGACSPLTQILTDTIPQKMAPLIFIEVYHDQTIVKWSKVDDFEATGRSPVINYTIQWDDYQYYSPKYFPNLTLQVPWKFIQNILQAKLSPDNPYITNDATEITFIHELLPNFVSRRKIMYRIQAINNVGESVFSEPLQVITVDRKWSKPHSWEAKKLPLAGESFTIPAGQNWTFDLLQSPVYGTVKVDGLLQLNEEAAELHFRMNNLVIQQGEMVVGTRDAPFQGNARITLSGGKNAPGYEFNQKVTEGGNKLFANFGKLRMFGIARNQSSVLLSDVQPGQIEIKVEKNLQWNKGDKLGFPPTNMRHKQYDFAIIDTYDPLTGIIKLEKAINYYHYGALNSTASDFSGIDMRGKVFLLSRNVLLDGENLENQGCQILTSSMQLGSNILRGQTFMDNIEIQNCSQFGSPLKAAFRFEDNAGLQSNITNVAMHHGLGIAVQIDNSQNINFINNTVWDFSKYGMNVSTSSNINIIGNQIAVIQDDFINEAPSSMVQPAGIVGCIKSDCKNLRVQKNVISGVSYAGFITAGHECGESSKQDIFRDNIAHSINGWGAVYFASQQSLTQRSLCVEGSYFSAYKCSQGGVIIYNATLGAYFSNMILIDNHIGGTIMIGSEKNENDTQIAIFRDSIFYGETQARDCSVKDRCSQGAASGEECVERKGLMIAYFSASGKEPLIRNSNELPIQKIMSSAAYGGESVHRNLTFKNFNQYYTWCSNRQIAIGLNSYGPDYHPRSKFFDTKFINVHDDTLVELFSPDLSWVDFRKCGTDVCTGPHNTFLSFDGTTFQGAIQPQFTKQKFQIAPYHKPNVGKIPGCHTFVKRWNAYICENPNLGILLFESRDDDKLKRVISPITITSTELGTTNEVNTFMSHQETVVTQLERLSRWPSLIATGKNRKYDVKYQDTPPQRQRFTLVADQGNITVRIRYPKAGAYILRDRQSKQFPANAFDESKRAQTPIAGLYCGENRYDSQENTLEFFMTPNCSIWIEGVDVIQTNVRLNWTLNGFKENGGTNKFKENLAESLGIKQTFIQILSVREGSVIVDFQIVQAEEDPSFLKSGGLSQVKNNLYQKIETQKLWLGAPILNATVVGRSINSILGSSKSGPVNAFDNQDKWDAKGTEVWIIPPPKKAPPAQVIVVQTTKDEIVEKTIPGSSLFAIIFGILLGLGIILCIVGIFLYRRYKRRKEESDLERAATEVDQHNSYNQKKKINTVDAVNQSGETPLKGFRDHTIYDDDEALDEQYHPMSHRIYSPYPQDEFSTNRKAKEEDYLMTQQNKEDERRTRDQFFDKQEEEQAQATFGIAPMSDRSISRESDTELENPVIGSIRSHSQADEEYQLTQGEQESPVKMLQRNHYEEYQQQDSPQEGVNEEPPKLDFTKIREDKEQESENGEKSFEVGNIDDDDEAAVQSSEENIVTKQDFSAKEIINPHAFKLQRMRENQLIEPDDEEDNSKPIQFSDASDQEEDIDGPSQKQTPAIMKPMSFEVRDFDVQDDVQDQGREIGDLDIEDDIEEEQKQQSNHQEDVHAIQNQDVETKSIDFNMEDEEDNSPPQETANHLNNVQGLQVDDEFESIKMDSAEEDN